MISNLLQSLPTTSKYDIDTFTTNGLCTEVTFNNLSKSILDYDNMIFCGLAIEDVTGNGAMITTSQWCYYTPILIADAPSFGFHMQAEKRSANTDYNNYSRVPAQLQNQINGTLYNYRANNSTDPVTFSANKVTITTPKETIRYISTDSGSLASIPVDVERNFNFGTVYKSNNVWTAYYLRHVTWAIVCWDND